MVEPVSIAIGCLIRSAPGWLHSLQDTLLDEGKGFAVEQGKQRITGFFDEKKHLRNVELALQNAAERGLKQFHTSEDRDQYCSILKILVEANGEIMRREAMKLFTLSDDPDLALLTEKYNLSQRISALAQHKIHAEVDAAPYLHSFFEAVIAEFYADPLFREQMSDVIRVRAAQATLKGHRTLEDIVTILGQIREILANSYTTEQFKQDVNAYLTYVENTFRHHKFFGITLRGSEERAPELDSIFVPPRVTLHNQAVPEKGIASLFEQSPYVILLGGPGSGKSITTRYLAWCHAKANLITSPIPIPTQQNMVLLPGTPIPLCIELRLLSEVRRQRADYSFLSYATEVLLKRDDIAINPQMFKELLERRTMFLLFDGLDEVPTLDERKRLIDEIETFAQHYPGNSMLVTSRPVGYDVACFANRWFQHGLIEEFNDEQIHLFLERWYMHVLKYSSLSSDAQRELEILHTTLKYNWRLRKLAANPLLLTVMATLNRSERLPDKRVQLYEKCADLLLDTWIRLKHEDGRWKDMKMGKEDQSACIAHLGFVLHQRSQDSATSDRGRTQMTDDTATDISGRLMLREIKSFLKNQQLFLGAEQGVEAERFLKYVKAEAGLIVERGTDENGEPLYGFVHRTFQEYFAAVDVYEYYQQEEDPTIISQFLTEHLHDPHWREVILLLFGKLKRKPATAQLHQVLEGKIKSLRSQYTDIVQQDLFFVCDCLLDEIAVESEFVEVVISRLSDVVRKSPFPSQREKALAALSSLMRVQQYTALARKELTTLSTQESIQNSTRWIQAMQALYHHSLINLEERQQVAYFIIEKAQQPEVPVEQVLQAVRQLYVFVNRIKSDERQQVVQILLTLAQRSNISIEQSVDIAKELYEYSFPDAEEQQYAIQMLLDLESRPAISIMQATQIAAVWLYSIYEGASILPKEAHPQAKERRRTARWVLQIAQQHNASVEEIVEIAKVLYFGMYSSLPERRQAIQLFLELLQQSTLSFEEILLLVSNIRMHNPSNSAMRQAIQVLLNLSQHSDLSTEQVAQIAQKLCVYSPPSSKMQRHAIRILSGLVQRADSSHEKIVHVVCNVYHDICKHSSSKSIRHDAAQILLKLALGDDLSFEAKIQVAWTLCVYSPDGSEEQAHGAQVLVDLAQRPGISSEQAVQAAQALYRTNHPEAYRQGRQLLRQMVEQAHQSIERAVMAALAFLSSQGLSFTQYHYHEDGLQSAQMLLKLLQYPELPSQLALQAALTLYQYALGSGDTESQQRVFELLLDLVLRYTYSFEQTLQVARTLYERIDLKPERQRRVTQMLWQLAQNQNLTVDQRLQAVTVLLVARKVSYTDRAQAVRIVLHLLQEEAARHYLEGHWQQIGLSVPGNGPEASDIPYIVELIRQELLPTRVRDEMYRILSGMVPQFANI